MISVPENGKEQVSKKFNNPPLPQDGSNSGFCDIPTFLLELTFFKGIEWFSLIKFDISLAYFSPLTQPNFRK